MSWNELLRSIGIHNINECIEPIIGCTCVSVCYKVLQTLSIMDNGVFVSKEVIIIMLHL